MEEMKKMKKIITLAVMLVLGLAVSGLAESWCPSCDLDKFSPSCTIPTICKDSTQFTEACAIAEPCDPIISVCDCAEGAFFKEGDRVGISLTMLTPGVYWTYGTDIKAKLFPFMNKYDATSEYDACDWRGQLADDTITDWDFIWGFANSLVYLDGPDAETDVIATSTLQSLGQQTDCTPLEITHITTCSRDAWEIDVNAKDDNDGDGLFGEDGYITIGADKFQQKYLLIDIPSVTINYSQVIAGGAAGTTAQALLCILDAADSEDSICTGCDEVCCCPIDLVKLCPEPANTKCIYFPYALYDASTDGVAYATGIVLTNISLDSATNNTAVAAADMTVDITLIDSKGNSFMGTLTADDFGNTVNKAFTVEELVTILEFDGVESGAVYISATANFAIDGEAITFGFAPTSSYAAATLARCCSGPCISMSNSTSGN
jgi:hypothetical protein